ncbi:hypothetical protein FOFC_17519 [Fusarium oxysporum]|nr:hypothetical protein FOFC_17519 [Fusarium oxysporum]
MASFIRLEWHHRTNTLMAKRKRQWLTFSSAVQIRRHIAHKCFGIPIRDEGTYHSILEARQHQNPTTGRQTWRLFKQLKNTL